MQLGVQLFEKPPSQLTMQCKGTLFTYLEISEDCKEASSIIDIQQPHFARTMKKIMRRISKGDDHICRSIKKVDGNGVSLPSGYEIVGNLETEPQDLLLAYLPGANGETELYRFPFVRLVVRKAGNTTMDDEQLSVNPPDNYSLKSIAQRLDLLTSSLAPLVAPKTPKPRRSRSNAASKSSAKANLTKMPPEVSVSAITSATPTSTQSKTLDVKPPSPQLFTVNSDAVVAKKVPFMDSLNDTIDNVLSRIRCGKDDQLFSNLEAKLYTSLDALPPVSAQPTESGQCGTPVDGQTNKTPKKRTRSPRDFNQSHRSEPSLHTTIRFTPITSRSSDILDGQCEQGSPELLSLELPIEADQGLINSFGDNAQQNGLVLESKSKSVRAKRRRRDGPS